MRHKLGAYIVLGALLLTETASAHHNMSALFDFNNLVMLTGTLTKLDWRNPHIQLIVDRKGEGAELETWSIEGPPPSFFRNQDITKGDFESAIGKPVTAEASRAWDGSRSGLLRFVNLPNGKLVSACPQNC